MKGIVLAGGHGTRLYPITRGVSKHLLPVYDKPMIYYPIANLMLAGIRDILIISTREDLPAYRRLLGDGDRLGVHFTYAEQPQPEGLAQAFLIGADFIDRQAVCLVLGDNIHYGHALVNLLDQARSACEQQQAVVFATQVNNPSAYGVVTFDDQGKVLGLEEKPRHPQSNFAVTGLYFYPSGVEDLAAQLKPSARGELEITDLNKLYLERGRLQIKLMGRGFFWLDAGTHVNLYQASQFVEVVEKRQGLKIACLEEIAFEMGYIDANALTKLINDLRGTGYGDYLTSRLEQRHKP